MDPVIDELFAYRQEAQPPIVIKADTDEPSATNETICPFCAGTIKKAAIICKHCGKDLPTDEPKRPDEKTQGPFSSPHHRTPNHLHRRFFVC